MTQPWQKVKFGIFSYKCSKIKRIFHTYLRGFTSRAIHPTPAAAPTQVYETFLTQSLCYPPESLIHSVIKFHGLKKNRPFLSWLNISQIDGTKALIPHFYLMTRRKFFPLWATRNKYRSTPRLVRNPRIILR